MTRVDSPHSLSTLPPSRQYVDGFVIGDLPGREHLERYLKQMVRRNFRRLTIQQALSTLKLFLALLRDTGKDCLEQVSRRDLEAFVEREQDRGLKLSSVKTKLDRVHAFLGFLIEEQIVGPEVLVRKIRLRLPQYLPRAMDPADVRKLLSVIEEVRDRALVLVLLRTGMRISELLALRALTSTSKSERSPSEKGQRPAGVVSPISALIVGMP